MVDNIDLYVPEIERLHPFFLHDLSLRKGFPGSTQEHEGILFNYQPTPSSIEHCGLTGDQAVVLYILASLAQKDISLLINQ